jgi:hypothetical protein
VDVHAVAEVEADRLRDREGGGGREHVHGPSTPVYFSMTGLAAASANASIEFVKVGRHVRISESALADFIDAGRVEPLTDAGIRHMMKGSRNAEPRRSPTFRQRAQT